MPTATVREQLTTHLGADWKERLVWLDGAPTAAASIGQVHRGRWLDHANGSGDEREVAVKVQYPGAGEALLGDLRQIARLARGVAPAFPGLDIKPLVAELQARAADELDYHLEAEAQAAYAEAFEGDDHVVVPPVVAVGEQVLVTEWMDSPHSLAHLIREGTQEERDHYGELFVRFLFEGPRRTGMLHADPHPGNFRVLPAPDGGLGRLGVLDFGAVARLEEGGMPEAMGRLMRIALDADEESLVAGLREEGFIKEHIEVDPALVLAYLAPFVEPADQDEFTFTREWMREQFERVNDPRSETFTLATKLNLPTSYLLIHRTWLGAIGLLSQLGTTAPFREILEESLPGFAD
jgi:predicted unusual protein kinase regulating ubiquinone biosynthesis (AarF/ABC1/UbiB family)